MTEAELVEAERLCAEVRRPPWIRTTVEAILAREVLPRALAEIRNLRSAVAYLKSEASRAYIASDQGPARPTKDQIGGAEQPS